MALRHGAGANPEAWPTPGTLILHLFYLEGVTHAPYVIGVFWTLCLEVQLYLVFVIILWLVHSLIQLFGTGGDAAQRDRITVLAVGIAYVVSLTWPLGFFGDTWLTPWFVFHWHKFLLGAIICFVATGRIGPLWGTAALLALALVAVARFWVLTNPDFGATGGIVVGLCTASLLAFAAARGALYRWLDFRPLLWLGAISYSLYLFHDPIIIIMLGVQKRIVDGSVAGGLTFLILTYFLSIVLAAFVNRWIEQPSVRLANQLRPLGDRLKGDQLNNTASAGLAGGIEGTAFPPHAVQDTVG